MIDIKDISIGDNVYYQPDHFSANEFENGVVKEIPTHTNNSIRVVYNCNGEWHRYKESPYDGWRYYIL